MRFVLLTMSALLLSACGAPVEGSSRSPGSTSGVAPSAPNEPASPDGTSTAPSGAKLNASSPGSGGGATSPSDAGSPPPTNPPPPSTPDAGAPPPPPSGGWWTPTSAKPLHFHWQLSTSFAYPGDVVSGGNVYDLDGESTSAATVASLHALGPDVKVVCYVDVGTWENYRSDASSFPASVLGASNGWPGEQWLDVRQQDILLPLMKTRFVDWCVNKGFDAIEPDNLDAWENNPGFPITHDQNISYDLAIAALAHSLDLSVGLKNLPEDAVSLEPSFDWALDEQCFEYGECSYFQQSFLAAGKAVWDIEYNAAPDCASASAMDMNAELRDLNLVGPTNGGYVYQTCIPDSQTTWP